jgi:hypothetical protein
LAYQADNVLFRKLFRGAPTTTPWSLLQCVDGTKNGFPHCGLPARHKPLADRMVLSNAALRGVALFRGRTRLDAEEVNRTVLVLQPPAARLGQISRLRTMAPHPTECALARFGRMQKASGNHRTRLLVEMFRGAAADTDDAIHVSDPVLKNGPLLAIARLSLRRINPLAQVNT